MPIYESIFIINANLPDDETNAVIKKMQDVVAKQGGEMTKFEDWGKRKLAYEVKKQKRGHYVFFQFKGGAPVVSELERTYKLTDAVPSQGGGAAAVGISSPSAPSSDPAPACSGP